MAPETNILKSLIYQDLSHLRKNSKTTILLLSPSSGLIDKIAQTCGFLNLPYRLIRPGVSPLGLNPLAGRIDMLASSISEALLEQGFFLPKEEEGALCNIIQTLKSSGNNIFLNEVLRSVHAIESLIPDKAAFGKIKSTLNDMANGRFGRIYHNPIGITEIYKTGGTVLIDTSPRDREGRDFGIFFIKALSACLKDSPRPTSIYIDGADHYYYPGLRQFLLDGRRNKSAVTLVLPLIEKHKLEDVLTEYAWNKVIVVPPGAEISRKKTVIYCVVDKEKSVSGFGLQPPVSMWDLPGNVFEYYKLRS